jgi:catechol 2,3-dioxygenase-like lactoylglutathione lyase family enzyme
METAKNATQLRLPPIDHLGVVVRDIDQGIKYYSSTFGLGPFDTIEGSRTGATIRGKRGDYRIKQAFARMGQNLLELGQVLEGRPIQQEFLETNGEGLHHLGFLTDDLDAEVARYESRGFRVIQSYDSPEGGVRFAFLDTNKVGGLVFELVWLPESMRRQPPIQAFEETRK